MAARSSTGSTVEVQAVYDYQGRSEHELSFTKDQIISNVAMLEGLLRLFAFFDSSFILTLAALLKTLFRKIIKKKNIENCGMFLAYCMRLRSSSRSFVLLCCAACVRACVQFGSQ